MKSKNYRLIAYYLSIFIILIGFIQLVPLSMLIFYPQDSGYAMCFLLPGLATVTAGIILRVCLKNTPIMRLGKHYDSILVVSTWLLAIIISTIPWMMSGKYNFIQAFFEMTSGFSTTGLTIVDVDNCPHIFLFFRSVTLFVGGVGFMLILTAAINNKYGMNIYNTEGHSDRLLPNLSSSAKMVFAIYLGYMTLGAVAYRIAGMPWFDAVNTSIAASSTGGFSVNGLNICGYHSLPIEIITMVIIFIGQINFLILFNLLKGNAKPLIHHCETGITIFLLLFFNALMISQCLATGYSDSIGEAARVSTFHMLSSMTTAGFSAVEDLRMLPNALMNSMTLLMLIGGNAESTTGGIKQYRVIVTIKGIYYAIKDKMMDPNVVHAHTIKRLGTKKKLEDSEIQSTTTYVLFYLIIFFIGSFIFSCYGYSLQESMFEFSSCISTVGLSVGITNFNASPVILWTACAGMFLGRMEIYIVFQSAIRIYRDATRKGDYH